MYIGVSEHVSIVLLNATYFCKIHKKEIKIKKKSLKIAVYILFINMLLFINNNRFLFAHYLCCFAGLTVFMTFAIIFLSQNHSNILKDVKNECKTNNFNQTICSTNTFYNDNAMNVFVVLFVIIFSYVGAFTIYIRYAYHNRDQNNTICLHQL